MHNLGLETYFFNPNFKWHLTFSWTRLELGKAKGNWAKKSKSEVYLPWNGGVWERKSAPIPAGGGNCWGVSNEQLREILRPWNESHTANITWSFGVLPCIFSTNLHTQFSEWQNYHKNVCLNTVCTKQALQRWAACVSFVILLGHSTFAIAPESGVPQWRKISFLYYRKLYSKQTRHPKNKSSA